MNKMKLIINDKQLEQSKEVTNEFDRQKTYNKFGCTNNYIGALGEILFDKLLDCESIEHTHNKLTYSRWGLPPFVINGKTVTVKTTKSAGLWVQSPKFDFTVYAQINDDETQLELKGFVSKNELLKKMCDKTANIVKRENRKDYVFNMKDMESIEDLMYFFKNGKWPKKPKQTKLDLTQIDKSIERIKGTIEEQ